MATELNKELGSLIDSGEFDPEVTERYLQRISEGNLTRDENPYTHFCVYFAAFDPHKKSVFVGHHKKSGLWLFNGGHIDRGEGISDALVRESGEEWGVKIPIEDVKRPLLLTITQIPANQKQICKTHYDIWCFVPSDEDTARFNQDLLAKEFFETRWLSIPNARSRITDLSTLKALALLEQRLK
ncbi:MAG: NUDIX domain-containing protein [Candidatus Daviesbacteria bacterium]|nr:MAG: NUDIX domain-containing protein [Candidatus Daviesbacteria bacterium]